MHMIFSKYPHVVLSPQTSSESFLWLVIVLSSVYCQFYLCLLISPQGIWSWQEIARLGHEADQIWSKRHPLLSYNSFNCFRWSLSASVPSQPHAEANLENTGQSPFQANELFMWFQRQQGGWSLHDSIVTLLIKIYGCPLAFLSVTVFFWSWEGEGQPLVHYPLI